MTEQQLQDAVVEIAGLFGWLVYHTHDSRSSQAGFPDLTLVKPPRLVFAELKNDDNQPTVAQTVWLDALGAIDEGIEKLCDFLPDHHPLAGRMRRPGVEAYLWRPADWVSGEIERALRASG